MSIWIYVASLLAVSVLIASCTRVVTDEELREDPWEKKGL